MKNKQDNLKASHALQLNHEEVDLIRKALHLEEVLICEILMDDIEKYQHQLGVIGNLYKKQV